MKLLRTVRNLAATASIMGMALASPSFADGQSVRIGYDVVPIHLAPLIFGLGNDVLPNKGVNYEPDLIRFRGSSLQLQALAADELDIAVLAFSTLAAGIVNARQDIVAIADVAQDGPGFSSVYGVLEDSEIQTVEDLDGKVLSINRAGGAVDMAARVVLTKAGLTPGSDVTILEAGFGGQEAMLREGKTDVAVFIAPFWSRAQKTGGIRPLFHQRDGLGDTQFLLYAAKKDFIAENREVLVNVMEDYIRGIRWLTDEANRDAALDMIAAWNKNDRSNYEAWALIPSEDYRHDANGKVNVDAMQSNINTLHELGLLRKTLDVNDIVDHSLVEEAAARIK